MHSPRGALAHAEARLLGGRSREFRSQNGSGEPEATSRTILDMKIEGAAAFNYLPLLVQAMNILRRGMGDRTLSRAEEYALQLQLCEEFHAPIFRSQMIDVVCVLPIRKNRSMCSGCVDLPVRTGSRSSPFARSLSPKRKNRRPGESADMRVCGAMLRTLFI